AECVGRARKNKNVGRGVRGRQFLAFEIASEERFGQRFGKLLRVRSVTDNAKLDRQSIVSQTSIRFREKIEILLARDATDVKQPHLSVFRAKLFETCRIAPRRMKEVGVDPARKDF